jgi:hypothetical protein
VTVRSYPKWIRRPRGIIPSGIHVAHIPTVLLLLVLDFRRFDDWDGPKVKPNQMCVGPLLCQHVAFINSHVCFYDTSLSYSSLPTFFSLTPPLHHFRSNFYLPFSSCGVYFSKQVDIELLMKIIKMNYYIIYYNELISVSANIVLYIMLYTPSI